MERENPTYEGTLSAKPVGVRGELGPYDRPVRVWGAIRERVPSYVVPFVAPLGGRRGGRTTVGEAWEKGRGRVLWFVVRPDFCSLRPSRERIRRSLLASLDREDWAFALRLLAEVPDDRLELVGARDLVPLFAGNNERVRRRVLRLLERLSEGAESAGVSGGRGRGR